MPLIPQPCIPETCPGSCSIGQPIGNYARRQEHGEEENAALRFTHISLFHLGCVDADDNKSTAFTPGVGDTVYYPNDPITGTPYKVSHVERHNRGTINDHLRLYLDRGAPPWPTNYL